MTRRHLEALANLVAEHAARCSGVYEIRGDIVLASMASALADWCETDNERFDREWFIAACRLDGATDPV